jgi:integrase
MLNWIESPFVRKNTLKALRCLVAACLPAGLIDNDRTIGVRVKVKATAGYATWTEADIAQFEAHHPIGTKERLAFGLLLFTCQRRGDVIRMGRQHLYYDDDGSMKMKVRQQKTGRPLELPVIPPLREAMAATPATNMTFLTTSHGQPFTANHFTTWFRKACREAGLPPGLTAHGLRKACCRHLAEAGCTAHQIMAISGHMSLTEAARYTKDAEQKRLASEGMNALEKEQNERKTGKPESPKLANLSQAIESKRPKKRTK